MYNNPQLNLSKLVISTGKIETQAAYILATSDLTDVVSRSKKKGLYVSTEVLLGNRSLTANGYILYYRRTHNDVAGLGSFFFLLVIGI